MKNLEEIQYEVSDWSQRNFGNQCSKAKPNLCLDSIAPLLGIVEEVGELAHVTLKYHQGIRGFDPLKYSLDRNDSVADILIYLCDYASREGINLQNVLNDTWEKIVSKRDWKENPEDNNRKKNT